MAPNNTGAQQEVAAPEKIPSKKTDFGCEAFVCANAFLGIGKKAAPFPKIAKIPRIIITLVEQKYIYAIKLKETDI